jgi:hypothetical protein
MDYLRDWIHNILISLLVVLLACVGMFIFMSIFYPNTISAFTLMGQGGAQIASALNLWPLLICFIPLYIIVGLMPRRRRK